MKKLPALFLALSIQTTSFAYAQEVEAPLPLDITFAVSSGYWELNSETTGDDASEASPAEKRRGFYKVFAVRQSDRTARVYMQEIEAGAQGLSVYATTELEAISALKPYVTDIRPENSTGFVSGPGLQVTVYLKTDPRDQEPESWTVLIDEFGELKVEKAGN